MPNPRSVLVLAAAAATAVLASTGLPAATAAAVLAATSLVLVSLPALAAAGLVAVPLFTRLDRGALLEAGGMRPKIIELLKLEPGLGITDVCDRLGIGWGTAVHHLTRLEGAGLVASQDAGRHRRFFLPGESSSRRTAVCVLSTEANRRLLEFLRTHPGATQTETCTALGMSAPLVHKYLARLIREQLVTSVRHWRSVQYYTGDSVATALSDYAQIQGAQRTQGPMPAEPPRPEGLIRPAPR